MIFWVGVVVALTRGQFFTIFRVSELNRIILGQVVSTRISVVCFLRVLHGAHWCRRAIEGVRVLWREGETRSYDINGASKRARHGRFRHRRHWYAPLTTYEIISSSKPSLLFLVFIYITRFVKSCDAKWEFQKSITEIFCRRDWFSLGLEHPSIICVQKQFVDSLCCKKLRQYLFILVLI